MIDLGYLIKGSNDIFSKWEPFSNDYDVQMEYFYNSISIIFNKRWGSLEVGYSSKNYLENKILNSLSWMPAPSIYAKLLYTNQKEITLK